MEKEKLGNLPISLITFQYKGVKLQLASPAQYIHVLQIKKKKSKHTEFLAFQEANFKQRHSK